MTTRRATERWFKQQEEAESSKGGSNLFTSFISKINHASDVISQKVFDSQEAFRSSIQKRCGTKTIPIFRPFSINLLSHRKN